MVTEVDRLVSMMYDRCFRRNELSIVALYVYCEATFMY